MSYANLSIALCYDDRNVREFNKETHNLDEVYTVEIVHENEEQTEVSHTSQNTNNTHVEN